MKQALRRYAPVHAGAGDCRGGSCIGGGEATIGLGEISVRKGIAAALSIGPMAPTDQGDDGMSMDGGGGRAPSHVLTYVDGPVQDNLPVHRRDRPGNLPDRPIRRSLPG